MKQITISLFVILLAFFSIRMKAQEQVKATRTFSIGMHRLVEGKNPNELLDVLIKGDPESISSFVYSVGGQVKYIAGNVVAARIPAGGGEASEQYPGIEKIDPVYGKIIPLDSKVDINNRIAEVRNGQSPLGKKYKGKGVVIGFLDTGIDFGHPDFWKNDSTTRIRYAWDQTLTNGPQIPPQFGYGNECDSNDINAGKCPMKDNNGHGTKVAGIAAGGGRIDSIISGVAPEADIIMVKINLNGSFLTSVVDGINYIFKKADELGKPVVINTSVGTYFGSHDGEDLASEAIEYMINEKPGRAVVAAAGNAGNYKMHLGYPVNSDTQFTWFKYNPQLGLVYFELWADTADFNRVNFRLSAESPDDYACCYEQRSYNVQKDFNLDPGIGIMKDSIKTPRGNCIGIATFYVEIVDGRYVVDVVIRPDSTNYLFKFSTFGQGKFDLWSHPSLTGTSEMVTDIPTVTEYPPIAYYRMPDNKKSMVSSWACSPSVLTVGSYVNRTSYNAYNGTTVYLSGTEGGMEPTSSLGPTREGRIKPDLLTSGQNVLTPLALWERNNYLNSNPSKLSTSGWHTRFGGTSAAAPIGAGAVALFFEKYPEASAQDVIHVFTNTALADSFTGSVPNDKAGYGKLDLFAAMTAESGCTDPNALNYNPKALFSYGPCLYDTAATGVEVLSKASELHLFPNPVTESFRADISELNDEGSVAVYALDGREILRRNFSLSERSLKFDTQEWPAGIYLLRLDTQGGKRLQSRIVKI